MASNMDEEAIEEASGPAVNNDQAELISGPEPVAPRWYAAFLPKRPRNLSNSYPDENPEGTLNTLNGVIVPVILSMFRYLSMFNEARFHLSVLFNESGLISNLVLKLSGPVDCFASLLSLKKYQKTRKVNQSSLREP